MKRAARSTQTLRDRIKGKIKVKCKIRKTIISESEEEQLVQYLEQLSGIGYGINRSKLNILTGELATKLGKKRNEKKISSKWYYGFLKRFDLRLKFIKPRALTSHRAAAMTQTTVEQYFGRLKALLDRHGFHSRPHHIFNMDETGLQPAHKPPNVIAARASKTVQAVLLHQTVQL